MSKTKKFSDSQPEIYTYFKYVLKKKGSHKKIVLKGKTWCN